MITIWNPSLDHQHVLRENTRLHAFGLVPAKHQSKGPIQLTANRSSFFQGASRYLLLSHTILEKSHSAHSQSLFKKRTVSPLSECLKMVENEFFDTVGVVLHVGEQRDTIDSRGHHSVLQNIYITDATENILLITNRGQTPFPFEESDTSPPMFAATNLIYRRHDEEFNIYKCSKSDYTEYFTNPKQNYLKDALAALSLWVWSVGWLHL